MSRRIGLLFITSLSVAGGVLGAPPSVTQNRLACIGHDANARITAHVEGHPASVRVYFQQTGDPCGEYYVDMKPNPLEPGSYSALLPLVSNDATSVTYQVRVQGAGAKEMAGEAMTAVVSRSCTAPPLSPEDLRAAKSIAIGLTKSAQHATPCHFKCNGVVNVITASGDLKPNEECRLILTGKGKPWWETPGAIAAESAALFGASALALHANSNGRGTPPSPARP
jgi:hypothetical protein